MTPHFITTFMALHFFEDSAMKKGQISQATSLNGKSPEQERPAEISGRKCGALLGGAEGAGSRRGKLTAVIHEQMHK